MFAALAAAVIALGVADPPEKKVQIDVCEPRINSKDIGVPYTLDEIPEDVRGDYRNYPTEFHSYRVYLRLINKSRFELKRPVLWIDAPANRRQPTDPEKRNWSPYLNNDCQTMSTEVLTYEKEDVWSYNENARYVIICKLAVDWHRDDHRSFYVRLVLDNPPRQPFDVKIAVTCENAEGILKKITIDPKKLLPASQGHS
jgi:hypothetical protein